jgi:DNA invertase Pin-like site-specific DNA recombinase
MEVCAGVYARISSDRDGTQLGVTRQLKDCRKLAESRDWTVVEEYVDNDVSAFSGRVRPEYERLLDAIKDGVLDALVVYNADRLLRRPRELEELIAIAEGRGNLLLATVTGDIQLATDDGRLVARMLAAFAAKESEAKSRRVKRKHEELAAAGKVSGGGPRPFGYEPDRVTIRMDEAAVIVEAAERFLAGDSLRSMCIDFDNRGVGTVTGKPWTIQGLRQILSSGRISGQREHDGEIVAPAVWPGIIPIATTARLRNALKNPDRRTNRTPRRYLLAGGLVRCGLCGAALVARTRSKRARSYGCRKGPGFVGCGGVYTVASQLEDLIVESVLYRLDSPQFAEALANPKKGGSVQTLEVDRDAEMQNLVELARLHGEKAITFREWMAAREPIERRIKAADRQFAQASQTTALAGFVGDAKKLRTLWHDLPLSRQQAVIKAVLECATVMPSSQPQGSHRFDPSRVKPLWRV